MKLERYFAAALLVLASCTGSDKSADTDPGLPVPAGIAVPAALRYNIISEMPHDTTSFTEGLLFYDGKLYESTGELGESTLRVNDLKTGRALELHKMSNKDFGEGISILNGKLYQLTWKNHKAYVFDLKDLSKPIKTFDWPQDGWGMTNNGKELIMSDGSANIYFVDPETFKVNNIVSVKDNNGPVLNINELEYVDGKIYANIWQTDNIVQIDPVSGNVLGSMAFPNLLKPEEVHEGMESENGVPFLNGIAYDSISRTMYITGKRWPKLWGLKLQ